MKNEAMKGIMRKTNGGKRMMRRRNGFPAIARLLLFHFFILSFFHSFSSCDSRTPEEKALQAASAAAEQSYRELLGGQYDTFLQGRADTDSLPDDYREQLVMAYKQYISTQRERHCSIDTFWVSNALIDSSLQQIQVFLMLQYGDSTQEEVVVPMVERNGVWKMK